MSDNYPLECRRCKRELCPADYFQDRAMMLLGRGYCIPCLEQATPRCALCSKILHQIDFTEGRALVISGGKYCEPCMERAVAFAARPQPKPLPPASESPDEAELETRRMSSRFVPPYDCDLTVKPSGLRRLLSGNAVVLWVDVCEGGLRAVLRGSYKPGDWIHGRMSHPKLDAPLAFEGQVRHGTPSSQFPGCMLTGLKFEEPSALLLAFIREVLSGIPSVLTLKPPTPKSPFPPARTA